MSVKAPSPFAYRDFRLYFAARFLSTFSAMGLVVALQWLLYDVARTELGLTVKQGAVYLGLLGLVQFLALLACFLPAGYAVDRFDRRHLARFGLAVEILCCVLLWLVVTMGLKGLWPLLAIALLFGAARALVAPALQALAPNLVPPAVLPTAIAWSSVSWQTAAIAGPAVTGFLLHWYGTQGMAIFCVVLLALSFGLVLAIRPVPRPARSDLPFVANVREGLGYVRSNRMVLGAISLDMFAVLLGGATAMLPVFARDILQVGESGFGWLRAAPAIGAGVVALLLTIRPMTRQVGPKMFLAVGVFGLATILFGLSRSFWLSMVMLVVLGAADMISVYVRSSLVQLHTPDAMRGRVSSVNSLFIGASNELGEMQSGLAAFWLGAVGAVVAGGAGAVLVTLLWAVWFPQLRHADRMLPPDDDPKAAAVG
jgi:MFS family permease